MRLMFVRLRLVHHVEVAVVVVADVLLIEPRQLAGAALASAFGLRMYQSETSSMPSGLACAARMIDVAQDAHRLFVGLARELVDGLDQLLRAEHFGGVQAAVDPDHRLAFLGQRARLIVGEALGRATGGARSPCSDRAS